MDQWIELLVLSVGLLASIGSLSSLFFSAREVAWSHHAAAAGPTPCVPVGLPRLNVIQRWMARTVRRKEAPDGDADCSPLYCMFHTFNREDNNDQDDDASRMGEARSPRLDRNRSDPSIKRMLAGIPVGPDIRLFAGVL
ncbi:hypothetical protein J19TS2_57600 [Cohnella xylanilytica]|nr:hypothetical protein J19TS2_57600 [Cohnella xylanilytica]